jgi:hypothetical protein
MSIIRLTVNGASHTVDGDPPARPQGATSPCVHVRFPPTEIGHAAAQVRSRESEAAIASPARETCISDDSVSARFLAGWSKIPSPSNTDGRSEACRERPDRSVRSVALV